MTGPVGGAGELTMLSEGEVRTIIYDALKNQFPAEGAAIMVAGCCAKPVLDALNAALAAKAPQGVPSRQQFECELYGSDEPLTHKAVMRIFDSAVTAAVPGPVSDDTIHHGPFPPATRSDTEPVPSCVDCGKPWTFWHKCEAAVPKPAPLTPDADAIEASSTEDAPLLQMKPARRSLAEKAKDEMSEFEKGFPYDAATPAPGAEPLHSLLPGAPVGEALRRLEHEVAVHILSESPAQEFMDDIRLLCRTLREALAAAPPAPTFGPGNYSCAVCGLGMVEPCEHWKATSNTSHVETEGESGRQPEVCHSPSAEEQEWLNAPMGDRHASAERVRQLAESWPHDFQPVNEGTLDEKQRHNTSTCRRCQLERALPPSTGEKSQ